ncbi:MAG: hypothetical protein AB1641_00645 [Thermodesulfobacteriota bacterium]
MLGRILILLAGTALLFGCAGGEVVKGPGVPLNTVTFLDTGLDQKVGLQSTDSRRSPSDTVEVWAVIKNKTGSPLKLEGRVQFFDRQKAPAEGPTAWQKLFLPPSGLATYREFSTKVMEVGYYYIEIREGR